MSDTLVVVPAAGTARKRQPGWLPPAVAIVATALILAVYGVPLHTTAVFAG